MNKLTSHEIYYPRIFGFAKRLCRHSYRELLIATVVFMVAALVFKELLVLLTGYSKIAEVLMNLVRNFLMVIVASIPYACLALKYDETSVTVQIALAKLGRVWKQLLLLSLVTTLALGGFFLLVALLPRLVGIGLSLLLLYIGVIFSLIVPLVVVDEVAWLDAFKKSFQLVIGKWWQTFVIIFTPIGFYIIFILLLSFLPIPAVAQFIVITAVTALVFFPVLFTMIFVQLKNLQLR